MKESDKYFGFSLPAELLDKLRYAARYDCRSTGSTVRWLVAEYVRKFEREHGDISLE